MVFSSTIRKPETTIKTDHSITRPFNSRIHQMVGYSGSGINKFTVVRYLHIHCISRRKTLSERKKYSLHEFFQNINCSLLCSKIKYSDPPNTGPSGIQMVIFRTLFKSGSRMKKRPFCFLPFENRTFLSGFRMVETKWRLA